MTLYDPTRDAKELADRSNRKVTSLQINIDNGDHIEIGCSYGVSQKALLFSAQELVAGMPVIVVASIPPDPSTSKTEGGSWDRWIIGYNACRQHIIDQKTGYSQKTDKKTEKVEVNDEPT